MTSELSKKIGVLIPTTSHGRPEWRNVTHTYLFNYTLKSFLQTMSLEHHYIFYIGIDDNDRIFSHLANRQMIYNLKANYPNTSYKFISMAPAKKGHLTKMWNILFKYAYEQGCDYFFQCGDDINFKSKYWINDAIRILEKNNNIGITAPICVAKNYQIPKILTQSFVSRKHMEIFGWYFPEEIINWFCDDWINAVYKPNHWFPLREHYCSNDGGTERYTVGEIDSSKKIGIDINFIKEVKASNSVNDTLHKLSEHAYKLASNHKNLVENFLKK